MWITTENCPIHISHHAPAQVGSRQATSFVGSGQPQVSLPRARSSAGDQVDSRQAVSSASAPARNGRRRPAKAAMTDLVLCASHRAKSMFFEGLAQHVYCLFLADSGASYVVTYARHACAADFADAMARHCRLCTC